jgi:mono/diheme cytochrome c family protein
MRYFLALVFLVAVVVVSIAGFRGGMSRRPPIELIPDMVRQAKVRPQTPTDYFTNGLSSREAVAGTIARGLPFADVPENTGKETGTTNFVAVNPVPVTAQLLARGRERFEINCLPCHGPQGDGRGITSKYGMAVLANLHDPRIVRLADGEIFNTIANGKNLMQGYGANVPAPDRWAIVAYVRALQLSRLGTEAEVPAERRAEFKR